MGAFIKQNLVPGEKVIFETRYHWIKYFEPKSLLSLFIIPLIKQYTTEFVITNHRVVFKTGWLSTKVSEIKHKAVEAVFIEQPLLGKLLGYGTIKIIGSGGTMETFENIHKPLEFKEKCFLASLNA